MEDIIDLDIHHEYFNVHEQEDVIAPPSVINRIYSNVTSSYIFRYNHVIYRISDEVDGSCVLVTMVIEDVENVKLITKAIYKGNTYTLLYNHYRAWENLTRIKSIYINNEISQSFKSINGVLYWKNDNGKLFLVYYPNKKEDKIYRLPENAIFDKRDNGLMKNKYIKYIINNNNILIKKYKNNFFIV